MINSMTGFGRAEILEGTRKYTVEMKSVNHRYFDVNIRMPKFLSFFDSQMRSTLKKYIQRGKIDLFITCEDFSQNDSVLKYNPAIAARYVEYYKQMAQDFGLEYDIRVSALGRCPEVLTLEENDIDEEEIWAGLGKAIEGACAQYCASREKEGENLKTDLLEKLAHMEENVHLVEERYPKIVEAYTKRLEDKVHELLGDTKIDESRLAAELVIFSDKICTDEETVRLNSHIKTMAGELIKGGAVGRKLDFIAQEMNREANTILSKANDLETSNIAIDLKTEIEKIREQIQNIE